MFYEYPAVVTPFEDGTGFLADVPDLTYCSSSGITVENAIDMITDALALVLVSMEDNGLEIAPPTDFKQFCEEHDGFAVRVQVDTDEYRAMLAMYPPESYDEEDEEYE